MQRLDGDAGAGLPAPPASFVVFVEGPRDRDILRSWSRLASARLARSLAGAVVILGGRQPARAGGHLRTLAAAGRTARGLCILDRDGDEARTSVEDGVDLELFTWSRRHIESYLLVPEAIRRAVRVRDHDGHFGRLLRDLLPALDDEDALRRVDAKRLLDRRGPVARLAGRPVQPGRIARAMRREELHPEVMGLLERLEAGLGLTRTVTPITVWRQEPALR